MNQPISVEQNKMWRLDTGNIIILVESLNHENMDINHVFTWSVICSAPKIDRTEKNLEAFYIAIMKLSLNEQ